MRGIDVRIEYKDICIRNAQKEDCEQLAIWWNNGDVMAHAGFPNGLGTCASEIEKQIATDQDNTKRRLIIEKEKRPIGEMSYYNQGNNIVEIGIKICNSSYQEKGLGRIILSIFIKELFNMGYDKIILDTNLKNKRAQHVYEILGFNQVRIRENCWKDQLGELQSAVDYELVQKNFVEYV